MASAKWRNTVTGKGKEIIWSLMESACIRGGSTRGMIGMSRSVLSGMTARTKFIMFPRITVFKVTVSKLECFDGKVLVGLPEKGEMSLTTTERKIRTGSSHSICKVLDEERTIWISLDTVILDHPGRHHG
jgi:hypothetical protein